MCCGASYGGGYASQSYGGGGGGASYATYATTQDFQWEVTLPGEPEPRLVDSEAEAETLLANRGGGKRRVPRQPQ